MIDQLREGDVVTVWKLDRLSRSVKDFASFIVRLENLGVGFRSLTESIDTTTAAGRPFARMVAAFAEYEREIIRERTRAGLEVAKREGRKGGRRFALNPAQQRKVIDDVSSGRGNGRVMRPDFQGASRHDRPAVGACAGATMMDEQQKEFVSKLKELHATRNSRPKAPRHQALTAAERERVRAKTASRCHLCGGEIGRDEAFDADHVLPLSAGGENDPVGNYLAAHRVSTPPVGIISPKSSA